MNQPLFQTETDKVDCLFLPSYRYNNVYTYSKVILVLFFFLSFCGPEDSAPQLSILSRFCVWTFLYFISNREANSNIQCSCSKRPRNTCYERSVWSVSYFVYLFVCLHLCPSRKQLNVFQRNLVLTVYTRSCGMVTVRNCPAFNKGSSKRT
jgi:hypothetical protein